MTDSKTATERLREMLDARGVEWYEPLTKPNKTWFPDENGINCCARPWSDALEIRRHGLTPEQAIAATLGSGRLTAEQVRDFLNRHSVFNDTTWLHGRQELVFDENELQAMADELNATLGTEYHGYEQAAIEAWESIKAWNTRAERTCRDTGECRWFCCSECGFGFNDIYANKEREFEVDVSFPKYCPNCGRAVKQ